MLNPALITWIILGIAILLLLSDRLRPDLVALLVALSLGLTGVLTPQETFSGFSRSAVITLLAIFILAEGLRQVGVTDRLGSGLLRLAGRNEAALTFAVTLAGALLSLFMNNIAAAAVLLPAVSGAAQKAGFSSSRLLMPLAFGTILGGMATLFTTTNIVASSLLRDEGLPGYGVLDFAPLGLPVILTGVLYLALLGRRWLPRLTSIQTLSRESLPEGGLLSIYRLNERLVRAVIPEDSSLIGKSLEESRLREDFHLNVIGVERSGQLSLSPSPQMHLRQGDLLLLAGRPEHLEAESLKPVLSLLASQGDVQPNLESREIMLIESVLAPRSRLIGHSLQEVHFREKYDINVIAIWRNGRPIRTNLSHLSLEFGDALLLLGPRSRLPLLRSDPDLILMSQGERPAVKNPKHFWLALGIMLISILAATLNNQAIGEVMLGGAIAMVVAGILTMDQAYSAVDWKSIFVIVGMLPLGTAIAKTGAAGWIGSWIVTSLGGAGLHSILMGLIFLTMAFTQIMPSATVIAIIVPIAIGIARQMGGDPRAMVMGVALASSLTFLTPIAHPVNILVMGPGGYRFRDYFKVGSLLTLLLLVVLSLLLPVFWPVFPHR